MATPSKPTGRPRRDTRKILIKAITPAQHAAWKRAAEATGVSLAEFVRQAADARAEQAPARRRRSAA